MATDYRIDPKLGLVRVTEAPVGDDELRSELQAEAAAAQDRQNVANEQAAQLEAQVQELHERLELAQIEQGAADEEVQFSASRIADLDETLRLRDELANSTPAGENAGGSEPVSIPVTVAAEVTA